MKEISSAYNPKENEAVIFKYWEDNGFFKPKYNKGKKPFVVAIPPPNVTGSLHMGHALNNTIQDVLVRWHRMNNVPTLWVPGTDHAGIATQNVVEKMLKKDGKSRFSVGRAGFIKEVWRWKDQYESHILGQLKTMGCSCDFSRTRFTMDDEYSKAVIKPLITITKKGIFTGIIVLLTGVLDVEPHFQTLRWNTKKEMIFFGISTTRLKTAKGKSQLPPPDPKQCSVIQR